MFEGGGADQLVGCRRALRAAASAGGAEHLGPWMPSGVCRPAPSLCSPILRTGGCWQMAGRMDPHQTYGLTSREVS